MAWLRHLCFLLDPSSDHAIRLLTNNTYKIPNFPAERGHHSTSAERDKKICVDANLATDLLGVPVTHHFPSIKFSSAEGGRQRT
mmetsp:Transcript_21649/g.39743  ORF Transcript_21649/g.39743 Transcript_21649/m.39743 type:complete len:84 (+) Transcript_21649:66-317(+)